MKEILRITVLTLLFPVHFIILSPIEYPLYRAYKKDKRIDYGYIKFYWKRVVILNFEV